MYFSPTDRNNPTAIISEFIYSTHSPPFYGFWFLFQNKDYRFVILDLLFCLSFDLSDGNPSKIKNR